MKYKSFLVFVLCMSIFSAQAQVKNTPDYIPKNQKVAESPTNTSELTVRYQITSPEEDFWGYVGDTLSKRSSRIAGNRLGPVNNLYLLKLENKSGYNLHERRNRIGKNIFERSFSDSSRDVFVDMIFVKQLEEDGKDRFTEFFIYLVKGSIGNTEEEHLDTISVKPQSYSLDKKWWEKTEGNGIHDYGVKLFRRTPYVYTTIGLGHVNHKPVNMNLRLYSMVMESDTGIPKIELSTAISCSRYSQFVIGGSAYPTQFDSDIYKPSASARYERLIFKNSVGKFLSVGVSSDGEDHKAMLLVNINL